MTQLSDFELFKRRFQSFCQKIGFFHSMKSTKVDQVYLMNAVVSLSFWVLFWYSFLFLISQMLLSKWSADHLRFYLYLAKRRREEYNNALLSSQSSNYQRSFILGNTNKNIISLRIHACNPILYPGIHLCIYKKVVPCSLKFTLPNFKKPKLKKQLK